MWVRDCGEPPDWLHPSGRRHGSDVACCLGPELGRRGRGSPRLGVPRWPPPAASTAPFHVSKLEPSARLPAEEPESSSLGAAAREEPSALSRPDANKYPLAEGVPDERGGRRVRGPWDPAAEEAFRSLHRFYKKCLGSEGKPPLPSASPVCPCPADVRCAASAPAGTARVMPRPKRSSTLYPWC